MTTMLFERVGAVVVLVHGREDPSDPEWDAYVAFATAALHGGAAPSGLLVTSLGGSPNAGQRKAIVAVADKQPVTTCVCTDSLIARGVVTAIRWLRAEPMHALPLHDLKGALRLLRVPTDKQDAVIAVVQRLQAELPP